MTSHTVQIPTISLSAATSSNEEEVTQIVETLKQACATVGFFYLQVDTNISESKKDISTPSSSPSPFPNTMPTPSIHSLLSQVFIQSKLFFNLPKQIKQQFSDPILNRGYTAMEEEWLDPKKQSKGDTKEGYYIGQERSVYNPKKLSGPNVWPTKSSESSEFVEEEELASVLQDFDCDLWKETMNLYFQSMSKIGFLVVQLLSQAIGLPKHYFDNSFTDPVAMLRLLHYSNEKSDPNDGIYGCGKHSDYGMITILATDENPGLQIALDPSLVTGAETECTTTSTNSNDTQEIWMDVPPPPPGTFIVNLGDMLERWTNGKFKSTIHRVINHKGVERWSIPFFYDPNFDTVVKCLDVCRTNEDGNESQEKYPVTTSGQHLLDKYKETHADFVIDS